MSNHQRTKRMIALISAMTMGSFAFFTPAASATEQSVLDKLTECVTQQAQDDHVTPENITELYCRFSSGTLDNLEVLKKYPHLQSVDLQQVKIASFVGLEALPELTKLSLYDAGLTDVTAIGKLTKLTELSLNKNDIQDVSPLANLTALTKLNIQKNLIFDLSPLKDLTATINETGQRKIELVRYVGDPIPVVKDKAGNVLTPTNTPSQTGERFTEVGTYKAQFRTADYKFAVNFSIEVKPADEKPEASAEAPADPPATEEPVTPLPFPPPAESNPDNSTSPVKDRMLRSCIRLAPGHRIGGNDVVTKEHVAQLEELHCVGRDIQSLAGLESAENLRVLDLTQDHITDLSPLNNLPNLEVLRLDKAEVQDLSVLSNLPKLKELYLSNNNLTDISALGNFPELTHLSLLKNNVTDISVLSKYPNLTFLNVAQNDITSLSPLATATKLEDLRAHHNKIDTIAGLENLKALTNLELGTNKLTAITELASLPQLRTVSVRENKITDISPLKNLTRPYRLDISDNPITNPEVLNSLEFEPKDPKADPNEPHGLINVKPGVAPVDEKPATEVPTMPEGALAQWYGAEGAATGSAIAQHSCDFNGDGKEDIVVGAWAHQEKPVGMVGVAYVLPNGSPTGDLDDPALGAIKIYGPKPASLTGFNVSCVGDVNGDGKADIGISSHKADRGYVVFGTDATDPIYLNDLGIKGIEFNTPESKIGAGWIVTGAGDLDGDGLSDVAVVSQAGGKEKRGEVTIVAGSTSNDAVSLAGSDRVLLRIVGNADTPVFNFTQAGDVDGDGVGDFLVGGYYATAPGAQAPKTGMAWVVSGKSRGTVNVFEDFDGFAIQGPLRGGDRLGATLEALGDINNDGFDDVMVAAIPTKGNGAVAVILGAAKHRTVTIDPDADLPVKDDQGSRGWWIMDSRDSGYLGYGMAAVQARNGHSGTIILGSSEASRVVAFDTSALTGNAEEAKDRAAGEEAIPLGGVVDLANVLSVYKVEVQGEAADRLGRAIGIVNGFNEFVGKLMVAGADRATDPHGRGSIILAHLPAIHKLLAAAGTKPGESGVHTLLDLNNYLGKANLLGPAAGPGAQGAGPGSAHGSHGNLGSGHGLKAGRVTTSGGLANTGAEVGVFGVIALMLLASGGAIIGYRKYRVNA